MQSPESPLVVLGERSLAAEFPAELKARAVLEAIGAGERAFSTQGLDVALSPSDIV